jgi:zinc/manganese transport system permease protein
LQASRSRCAPDSASRGRELAAFYFLSLASGVLIVSLRGNSVDLLHVLFGTVLALDDAALILIGAIATITMLTRSAIYRPLNLACLDPMFLRSAFLG